MKNTPPLPHQSQVDAQTGQLLARAHRAIRLLETRKKAVVKEHGERIKRLRQASDLLVSRQLEEGLDLESQPTLSPDLLTLIDAPDEGL